MRHLAFSPDDQHLFVGGNGGGLIQLDVASGEEIKRFGGRRDSIYSLAVGQGGEEIVSSDATGSVIVWDVASGQRLVTLTSGGAPTVSLDWHAASQRIVAGKADGTVQIWTLPTQRD